MRASGITVNEKIMQNKYVEGLKREEHLVSVQGKKKMLNCSRKPFEFAINKVKVDFSLGQKEGRGKEKSSKPNKL